MIKNIFSFKTIVLAFVGMVCLGVTNVYATDYFNVTYSGYNGNFATFAAAFAEAKKGNPATITLLNDYTSTDFKQYYDVAKKCTLNLNGFTITKTNYDRLLQVNTVGAEFTITDTSAGHTGKIDCQYTAGTCCCVVVTLGTIRVEGGTLSAINTSGSARAIYAERIADGGDNPHVIITGDHTNIYAEGNDGSSVYAAAVFAYFGGTVDISGNPVLEAKKHSRTLWFDNNGTRTTDSLSVNISGGTFKGDYCCIQASNLYLSITITGGAFSTSNIMINASGTKPQFKIKGGYFGTTGNGSVDSRIADGYKKEAVPDDDVMAHTSPAYAYRVVPSAGCEAKVKTSASGSNYYYYTSFTDAFAYAQTQSGATTYLLRNITYSGASYLNYNPASAISNTLNLQTFTITGTNTADRLLNVAKGTLTVTGTTGGLSFTRNTNAPIYGAYVNAGARLDITGGSITCRNTNTGASANAYGCNIAGASSVLKVKGSTSVTASTASSSAASAAVRSNGGTTTISDSPTFTAKTGVLAGDSYAGYSSGAKLAQVDITGGTFTCSELAVKSIRTPETTGNYVYGMVDIQGGKFHSDSENLFAVGANDASYAVKLKGGYFNETSGTTHKDQLLTFCYGNNQGYAVFSSSTPGYSWEVKNGCLITLKKNTGDTDGYAVATKNSTSLSDLVPPTKTGYHPTGEYWTAASSGSKVINANQTYVSNVSGYTNSSGQWTLTSRCDLYPRWTPNTYTVQFHGNGNTGGSTANQGFTYGTAQNLRANGFTKTGYVFAGWATSASGAVVYSNSQSVNNLTTTNGGTVNLYAKWTKVVATVTVGSGSPTPYTDFQTAFNYAQTQAGAVLQLQDNITYSTEAYINYYPSTAIANTLDLNGYTLTGGNSGNRLLNLGRGTYTIKDSRTGGKLSFSKSGALYGVVVNAGTTLNLQSGTVYCENTGGLVHAIHTDNGTINISGSGKVDAQGTTEATAVYAITCSNSGTGANISGNAVISATSTDSNGKTYAIRMINSPITVTGGTVNAKANTKNSYCFRVDGASSVLNISGGTFNIDSDDRTNGYNCGIITYAGTTTISGGTFKNYCTGMNCAGIRALAGTVTINGTNNPFFDSKVGILAADAAPAQDVTTQVIVNINGGTFKCTNIAVDANQNPQPAGWASATTRVYSTVAVTGGKFYTTLADPYLRVTTNSSLTLTGGYYNETSGTVHKDQLENLTEDPYHPVELTSAEKSSVDGDGMTFKYKIVPAYDLTFAVNTAGYGTVSPSSITRVPTGTIPTVSSNTVTVYGTTVTATAASTTAQYSYAFTGWSNATAAVTADRTITANFTRTTRQYTITWKNEAGTSTLETDANQNYGTATAFNQSAPTKAATAQYTYTFDGWTTEANGGGTFYANGSTPTVSGNATYYAHFAATTRSYTIRFLNYNGTVLQSSSVNYGVTPTYSGSTPTKPTDASYTYAFTGWSPTIAAVSGAQDYTAQFSSTANVASVTPSGGSASYYSNIKAAFDAANDASAAVTIQLLKDCSSASALSFAPSSSINGTLDLNNFTLTGTVHNLLTINKSGKTFTITDTSGSKGGNISNTQEENDTTRCVTISAGTLSVQAGTIYAKNNKAYNSSSAKAVASAGVYVGSGTTLVVNNGTVEAEGKYGAFGIFGRQSTTSTITINNGTIYGHTNSASHAAGINTQATGLTVNNGTIKGWSKTSTARGVFIHGGGGTIYGGNIEAVTDTVGGAGTSTAHGISVAWLRSGIRGTVAIPSTSTVVVKAVANTSTAHAVSLGSGTNNCTVDAGTYTARTKTGSTAYGVHSMSENAKVRGGEYHVTSGTTGAYGVYCQRYTTTISGSPVFYVHATTSGAGGVAANGSVPAKGYKDATQNYSGTVVVNGGTYNVSTGSGNTAQGACAFRTLKHITHTNNDSVPGNYAGAGTMTVNDGVFNVTAYASESWALMCSAPGTAAAFTLNDKTYSALTATPKLTVNDGKFYLKSNNNANTTCYLSNTGCANTDLLIQGGFYSTNKTNATNSTIADKYVHPGKASSIYRCFTISPALESKYNYKVARFYTISYNKGTNGTGTNTTDYKAHGDNITLRDAIFTRTGYTQDGWSTSDGGAKVYNLSVAYTANSAVTLYPHWAPNTTTAYTVNHYQQNLDGTYPSTPTNTDNLTGTTGASVTPAVKSYTGFTAPSTQTVTILADGSRVVEYKYTRNSYTLTWDANGGSISGSYTSGTVKYGATITKPSDANVTRANYVFTGWNTTPAATMPAANTTYTAQWTAAVASVTINGTTSYYTTLADAFTAANASTTYEPTIKVLRTVTGITSTLQYTNSSQNGILDLNNCTLSSSTLEFLLAVNSSTSKTLTITDSSGPKNGEIRIEANRDWVNVVGVWKGKLILNNGKIYGQNTSTTTDKNGTRALYLVEGQQAEINGGTLEANGQQKAYAIYDNDDNNKDNTRAGSTITINNGTFKATTTARNIAYGIMSKNSTVTINGGTFTVTSETYDARGINFGGATLTLNGGTFHVKAKTYQAYGIAPYWIDSSHRTYLNIPSTSTVVVNDTAGTTDARAIDAGYARHTIDAGTFNAVTLTDAKAYGIYAKTEYVYVTGGTFNVEAGKSLAAGNANKKEAYGIYMCRSVSSGQPVKVSGTASFTVKADSYAYGLYATSILSTTGRDGTRNSWADIRGGSFDVQAATNAWGVYTMGNKGQMTISGNKIDTVTTAQVTISGGEFKVDATNAIGIQTMKTLTQGSFSRSPKTTVSGGKFKISGTGALAVYKEAGLTTTEQNIQGGYYSINDNLADYVVSPKRVFATTAADKTAQGSAYNWKVVTGYAIAYNKGANGTGTNVTDYKAHGDAITLRGITFTRTGYTQDGWSTSDGGEKVYNLSGSYTANSGTTLYPHWSINTYTVTIVKNVDAYGTISRTSITGVPYGSTFSTSSNTFTVNGTTVTATAADATAQYSYAFSSWTNATGTVTGNVTITANFTRSVRNYTVTVSVSPAGYGSVSASSITSVPYGTAVSTSSNTLTVTGKTPVTATAAATTAQYTYAFSSWSGVPATVTGNVTITANFTRTARTYTVTLNTNGGTINAGNVTSYTYGIGATLPTDVTLTGYDFAGWYNNSELTGDRVYSITTSETGNKTYWAKWVPAALRFTKAGNWNVAANWTPAYVPTAEHDVIIQKPCTVTTTDAVAKSVVIDRYSTNTGELIINANKGLNVTGTIQLKNAGGSLVATTPDVLFLGSSASGNASLIFSNPESSNNQAWVQMYSKADYPQDGVAKWQYVGTPFTGTTASPNYDGSWLYRWNHAISNWEGVSNANTIDQWIGYCLTQRTATTLNMEGTLLPTTESVYLNFPSGALKGTPDVFANSWTAPIQLTQMDPATDFTNVTPTIYFFNTGTDSTHTGTAGAGQEAAGTYRTVSISAVGVIDALPSKISSMQGFYVKKANTASEAYVTLDYSKHVRPTGANTIDNGAMYAPKRNLVDKPEVMKIVVQGSRYGTDLYLLAREDFSRAYDLGWDGENINGAGAGPLLYTLREDGTKDAISAIPDYEGALVGFQAGEDSEYTFSFTYEGDEVWYLNDLLTHTSTRISAANTYTFLTTDNDELRFIISATPLAKVHEGIDDAQAAAERPEKVLVNDKLYIKVQTRTYDATGKLVENNK